MTRDIIKERKKEAIHNFNIDPLELMRINAMIISNYDLFQCVKEYKKTDHSLRNYDKIDKIVKDLKFFQKYNRSLRINILNKSRYTAFFQGQTIFKQD